MMPDRDETKAAAARAAVLDDRRGEARSVAAGPVELQVTQAPLPRTIQGTLVDLSRSGFRAQHLDRFLEKGEVVRFSLGARSGKARVIWNRLVGDCVETGFWVFE